MEHFMDDLSAQRAGIPVVGAGNWARHASQRLGQRSPDQHKVGMAVVIAEVDELHR
jgi:hypothetical protein